MFKIVNYDKRMREINPFNISSTNVGDDENLKNYISFILSIKEEFDNVNSITDLGKKHEKKHDIEQVIYEYFGYFMYDSALHVSVFPNIKGANILIYYEIQNDNPIYIGSVLFKIKDNILYFISIYKSIINTCFSCSEKKISSIMLDYLLKIAKENSCSFLVTYPLDVMKPVLSEKYGFKENVDKPGYYLKNIEIEGGNKLKRTKSIKKYRYKLTKKRRNKKRTTLINPLH